jgi:hypothetical protein
VKKIQTIALKTIDNPWFYPLALLLIGIITYGVMLPRLGFYWDDWEGVYLYKLHIPAISFHFYAERPFSALAYLALFPLAKMTPIVWHVVSLILRWVGVVFVYCILNAVWPRRLWQNRWIGVLLFVFPGFLDQPVSVAFSPHLTTFVLFSGSLLLTVLALKNRALFWLWMPLSVFFGIAQIFMMEYFVGLEILRPLVIWFVLQSEQENKKRIFWKTICYWLPFLIGLSFYAWWRFLYIPSTLLSDPNNPVFLKTILGSPVNGLITLIGTAYQDIGYLLATAWAGGFSPDIVQFQTKLTWLSWFLGIGVALLFTFYGFRTSHDEEPAKDDSLLQLVLFGSIAIVAGAIPVWSIGRQIAVGKWSDRFSLAPMLGAVILVVTVLDWLIRTRGQKRWVLAILLASSISLQVFNANKFRLDWEIQRNLYWQLAWRIPSLQPGTAIIGKGTFTDKSSYYDGVYIINLLFDKQVSANPRYDYFDIFHLTQENYFPDIPITSVLRGGQFSGNTSHAVGMYFTASAGCVRLLDQVYADNPDFNDSLEQLIHISNLDQIVPSDNPTSPDPTIFGPEPSHGWCYYFEKSDLARQLGDWQAIIQLASTAESKGYGPVMGSEYIPFIEAYVRTGDWSKAYDLSLEAQKITPKLEPVLCNNWNRFSGIAGSTDGDTYLAKAKSGFCGTTTK